MVESRALNRMDVISVLASGVTTCLTLEKELGVLCKGHSLCVIGLM